MIDRYKLSRSKIDITHVIIDADQVDSKDVQARKDQKKFFVKNRSAFDVKRALAHPLKLKNKMPKVDYLEMVNSFRLPPAQSSTSLTAKLLHESTGDESGRDQRHNFS